MRGLYRVQVTDLGPYRAIRRDLLGELEMCEMTFGWPTEMMVKALDRAPVSTKCRSAIWRAPGALESGRQPARLDACSLSDPERHAAVRALSWFAIAENRANPPPQTGARLHRYRLFDAPRRCDKLIM